MRKFLVTDFHTFFFYVKSNDKKIFVAGVRVFNEFACRKKRSFGLCLAGSEERLFIFSRKVNY